MHAAVTFILGAICGAGLTVLIAVAVSRMGDPDEPETKPEAQ